MKKKEEEKECQIANFYFARCLRKLRYYSDVIHSFDWKSAIEHYGGVMRDSVPSARYSSICNVLRLLSISLIPTYRVYRLYDTFVLTKYNLIIKMTYYKYRNNYYN